MPPKAIVGPAADRQALHAAGQLNPLKALVELAAERQTLPAVG